MLAISGGVCRLLMGCTPTCMSISEVDRCWLFLAVYVGYSWDVLEYELISPVLLLKKKKKKKDREKSFFFIYARTNSFSCSFILLGF